LALCRRALSRAARLLTKARQRSLVLGISHLRQELLGTLKAFQDIAHEVRSFLERPPPATADLSTLMAELRQLEEEFGGAQIDWRAKALVAVTEPIVLRDVALGAFAIRLCWPRLPHEPGNPSFEVVALHPHRPGADERVTHPHVRNNALCAGEATAPLRTALEQGRLADAFCLVRSVLRTYNAANPFVPLSGWDSGECHDCGCLPGDDRCCCEGCGHDYCSDCTRHCDTCEAVRCSDCMGRCAVCDSYCCAACSTALPDAGRECCPDCVRKCSACGGAVAPDDLPEDTTRCPACTAQTPPASAEPSIPAAPSPETAPSFPVPENANEPTAVPSARTGP
jgi:hypothetical protein